MRYLITALALAAATPALAQSAPAAPAAPKVTYIHAGQLLADPARGPRGNSTVIVRDGKIAEIRDGFVTPEGGAALVDLKDKYVLPGLIDMHVHFYSSGYPLQQRLEGSGKDREDAFAMAAGNARRTLLGGFTTVRDLGSPEPRGIRALRDAIAKGDFEGPTIVNAGAMISVTAPRRAASARSASGGMSTATAPSRDRAAMATNALGRVSISTPTRAPCRTPTSIRPRTTLLMRRSTAS